MSDFEKLINASDLIEWIMEAYPDWCVGAVRSIVDHVEDMPSAQPLVRTEMSSADLISRQALCEYALNQKGKCVTPNDIMRFPSAQPVRKGRWIVNVENENTISGSCSACGWQAHLYEDDVVGMNFCPNCGCRMEGEQE